MGGVLLLQIFDNKLIMALQKKKCQGITQVRGILLWEPCKLCTSKSAQQMFHWKHEKLELLVAPDKK